MYPSVSQAFAAALAGEGYTRRLYLDRRSLASVGRGNMVDPAGGKPLITYSQLTWQHADGSLATAAEVQAAYLAVKTRADLIPLGGADAAWGQVSDLTLTDDAVTQLVTAAIASLWRSLVQILPNLETWPADAQLGLLRYAWANGPAINYKAPHMYAALGGSQGNLPDFRAAAKEAHWTNENADVAVLIPQLFNNAADVVNAGLDGTTLVWPNGIVQAPDGTVTTTEPTQFGGDPIDWSGFPEAQFGLTAFAHHSLADVAVIVWQYNKWIANLRSMLTSLTPAWNAANPAQQAMFDVDLEGLEYRWAQAVSAVKADRTHGDLSRWWQDFEQGVGVILEKGKVRAFIDGMLEKAVPDSTVPAETSYQSIIHAIRQKGEGQPLTTGDYEDLIQRINAAQDRYYVQATPAQLAAQVPTQRANPDVDSSVKKRKGDDDDWYWAKVAAVAITAGLVVNAVSTGMAIRNLTEQDKERLPR